MRKYSQIEQGTGYEVVNNSLMPIDYNQAKLKNHV